jgi:tRNA 2-selenouridine synthase SelU
MTEEGYLQLKVRDLKEQLTQLEADKSQLAFEIAKLRTDLKKIGEEHMERYKPMEEMGTSLIKMREVIIAEAHMSVVKEFGQRMKEIDSGFKSELHKVIKQIYGLHDEWAVERKKEMIDAYNDMFKDLNQITQDTMMELKDGLNKMGINIERDDTHKARDGSAFKGIAFSKVK